MKNDREIIEIINIMQDNYKDEDRGIEIIKINESKFKIKIQANTRGFKFWVLRNLDGVEVIRPLSLRNEIKKVIEEAENKYKKEENNVCRSC